MGELRRRRHSSVSDHGTLFSPAFGNAVSGYIAQEKGWRWLLYVYVSERWLLAPSPLSLHNAPSRILVAHFYLIIRLTLLAHHLRRFLVIIYFFLPETGSTINLSKNSKVLRDCTGQPFYGEHEMAKPSRDFYTR